jgi:two-component system, cell cycle sensor histidine kinase and response regulator CckA
MSMLELLRKLPGKKADTTPAAALPAPAPAPAVDAQLAGLPQGTEAVLLVEDEEPVREYMATLLAGLGYKVFQAADGEEALRLINPPVNREIDLLITDIIMPRMGGKELVYRLRDRLPQSRMIFCSAYPGELATRHRMLTDEIAFLQKPVTPQQLAILVRQRLDAAAQQQPN